MKDDPGPNAGVAAVETFPVDDPYLRGEHDLAELEMHWRRVAARPPMTAEEMRGADRRAQGLGVPGAFLMEQAGAAVAAAARALLIQTERTAKGPILVLAGPGNNGGDGSVAARFLAQSGHLVAVVLVSSEARPGTPDAATNWNRLAAEPNVDRLHAPTARDVRIVGQHVDRAAIVIDALLGTGVSGTLRDPILSAVELANQARAAAVPVLAVDTPTAVDLTSGRPSDPVVRADVTVTFHRPKQGLLSRVGRTLAGRILVAPIGIPSAADRV